MKWDRRVENPSAEPVWGEEREKEKGGGGGGKEERECDGGGKVKSEGRLRRENR